MMVSAIVERVRADWNRHVLRLTPEIEEMYRRALSMPRLVTQRSDGSITYALAHDPSPVGVMLLPAADGGVVELHGAYATAASIEPRDNSRTGEQP